MFVVLVGGVWGAGWVSGAGVFLVCDCPLVWDCLVLGLGWFEVSGWVIVADLRLCVVAGSGWVVGVVCTIAVGCRGLGQSVCGDSLCAYVFWVVKEMDQSVWGMLLCACVF